MGIILSRNHFAQTSSLPHFFMGRVLFYRLWLGIISYESQIVQFINFSQYEDYKDETFNYFFPRCYIVGFAFIQSSYLSFPQIDRFIFHKSILNNNKTISFLIYDQIHKMLISKDSFRIFLNCFILIYK